MKKQYARRCLSSVVFFLLGASSLLHAQSKSSKQRELGRADSPHVRIAGIVLGVDETPAVGARVHVVNRYADIDAYETTNASGEFQFQLRAESSRLTGIEISATSSNAEEIGYFRIPQTEAQPQTEEVVLQLEASKVARIMVVNSNGQPVQGANVAMQLNYPVVLPPVRTDASGSAVMRLPKSERIESVVAWKDHEGLDYEMYTLPRGQSGDKLVKKPSFPLEGVETLTLTGATPLTLHVTDDNANDLHGIRSHVWLLQKPDSPVELNLSYYSAWLLQTTQAKGITQYNWFPNWQKGPTTLWANADGFVNSRGNYNPSLDDGKLEMQLERLRPIRGNVKSPDGKPASGISISASGAGYTLDGFRTTAMTDAKGHYEMMVAPNQVYILSIYGQEWSAPSQSGFAVLKNQDVPGHDFALSKATKLIGHVVDKATGQPVPNKYISLSEKGVELRPVGQDILPNPEKSNKYVCPTQYDFAFTGDDGAFEFLAGDGEYRLLVNGLGSAEIIVAGEAEVVCDVEVDIPTTRLFSGRVLDNETNRPVAGAQIEAISRVFTKNNDWRASTTDAGKFQVERVPEPTYLHVTDAEQRLGAIQEIDDEQDVVEIRLAALGIARGRLMTQDGKLPAAGVKLHYGVSLSAVNERLFTTRFGSHITTDEDGHFELTGLVAGHPYECNLAEHPGGSIVRVANVTVTAGQSVSLGDIAFPELPKPYVPPTLDDRIQGAFDVAGTPLERFEKAQSTTKLVNQNLLIVFGEPSDSRIRTLMEIRYEDPDFRAYSDDFRIMAIPVDEQRDALARELASEIDVKLGDESPFLLVICNRDGKVKARLDEQRICRDGTFAKDLFFFELDKHRTIPLDAQELLDNALAKAKQEGKRVIVQETATWCGPCHRLSRLLMNNRQWEKDYIWVKMDHRWTGAREIMQDIRDGAEGGIPWFAVLDASGNKLATSNLPDNGSNIGFPSEDDSRKHFADILTATSSRMSEQEIADLVEAAKTQQ